jgi:mono/diheme cytochrome c family protein
VFFSISEYYLQRKHTVSVEPVTIAATAEVIARGQRVAVLRGCHDCHGARLEGKIFFEEGWTRIVAPNLTVIARSYSDTDLVRAIRHGVKPDGRSVSIMPSSMLYQLSDADCASLIAYLRSVPAASDAWPTSRMGLVARYYMLRGIWPLEADVIDHSASRVAAQSSEASARGRYLARTMCPECHGLKLEGIADPFEPTPDLALVHTYTRADFGTLMRTGVALGGRQLALMHEAAIGRFAHLNDSEVSDLYAYLHQLGDVAAR